MSEHSLEADLRRDRVIALAERFVDEGKVVPGVSVDDDGVARSWWWPLPAAGDREALAALLAGDTPDDHRALAAELADLVDGVVRTRLGAHAQLAPRHRGRRTVPEAWLVSLDSTDPRMPPSLDGEKVADLATLVDGWIRTGAATASRARLCLRVHEPPPASRPTKKAAAVPEQRWPVELLVQDHDDPSLIVPAADLWNGTAPFSPGAFEDVLAALGRLPRLAPELAAMLHDEAPTGTELDGDTLIGFVHERVGLLDDAGIAVQLPVWWARRGRVGLRARARSRKGSSSGSTGPSGFGMDSLVAFTWEAALGEHKLTAAELAELARVAEAKQRFVQLRGEWVEVRPDEIATLLRHVGTSAEATAGDLLRVGLGLDTIDDALDTDIVGVTASGWLGELLDGALHSTVAPVATPEGFVGELRPYQERGVGWLRFLGRLGLGACLADDMGLGKTAQLIATILADPAPGPTLVVCPVSVLGNWERELARFTPQLKVLTHHGPDRIRAHRQKFATRAKRHDVVLTTYSLVPRDREHLEAVDWTRLVLDEAQQVKNPGTAQARAVARLRSSRRIALTGTPVENRLSELWSLMHILNPGLLGSARSFRDRFAVPIEVGHDDDAAELLRRVTGPFVLRRLKSDKSIIDDLPDKIEQTERCVLTREQATLYQAVVDDLLAQADESEGIERRGQVLAGIMKLKQICNHPAHFLRDGSALTGRSGKLTRVEELLDEITDAGDKVLCFTQFAEWGELLVDHLARRYGREPLWLHGGVSRPRREKLIEAFSDTTGPPIFLLSLKAGGTGLNLTAASHVIHLDRWWNPAVEDQATDRAHRIGQRRTVLVHKLVATGTIEERIDEMITSKRALAQKVVGAGEQWVTELTTDELREVLALRADTDDGADVGDREGRS